MTVITNLLSLFPGLTMDQVNGLIALSAVALAGFTVYVVFAMARGQRS